MKIALARLFISLIITLIAIYLYFDHSISPDTKLSIDIIIIFVGILIIIDALVDIEIQTNFIHKLIEFINKNI